MKVYSAPALSFLSKMLRKDRTMLKKSAIAIMLAALLSTASAYAETIKITDIVNGVLTIEGTAEQEEDINILILSGGSDITAADESKIVYQGSAVPDKNKKYSKNISLTSGENGYAEYDVYTSQSKEPTVIAVTSIEKKTGLAKKIWNNGNTDKDVISSVLSDEQSRKILSVNNPIEKNADIAKVSELLAQALKNQTFDFDNTDNAVAELTRLADIIEQYCLTDCYNNSKSEILFNGEKILYDDILNFAGDSGVTVYERYKDTLNSAGKADVQKSVVGHSFKNTDEIKRYFAKLVMFNGIHNDVNAGGYGHIIKLFTAKNIEFAGLNIPVYSSLSESKQSETASKLIKDNSVTLDNMEAKIEEYAKQSNKFDIGGYVPSSPGGGTTSKGSGISAPKNGDILPDKSEAFDDIQSFDWAKEAILSLNEKGIMTGTENKKFRPSDNLTREQAVKIICIVKGYEINGEDTEFDDVIKGGWYAPYVKTAVENGIVNGIGENIFGVGKSVSRQDFAVMMYRALADNAGDDAVLRFSDSEEIADYAQAAVKHFVSGGIISGYDDNTFRPNGSITRAEAAKIIYNIIK